MNETIQRFPALAHLCGAYFHQDWMVDDPDLVSVIRRFRGEHSRRKLRATVGDIESLLVIGLDEQALQSLLESLGCAYDPGRDGLTYQDWLCQVRDQLKA